MFSFHSVSIPAATNKGFTLLELLVAMAIGTFVAASGISLYRTSLSMNHSVTYKSELQVGAFFVSHVLRQQFAQIGYRPIDESKINGRLMPIADRSEAFPEVPEIWETGQTIVINENSLSFRFRGAANTNLAEENSIYDCLGRLIDDNSIQESMISVVDNQLICTSNKETGVILGMESGVVVEDIAFEISVDDDGDNVIDRSLDAASASNVEFINARQLGVRLLLATPDRVLSDNAVYHFNGAEFESTDRKLRLETTVFMALRN